MTNTLIIKTIDDLIKKCESNENSIHLFDIQLLREEIYDKYQEIANFIFIKKDVELGSRNKVRFCDEIDMLEMLETLLGEYPDIAFVRSSLNKKFNNLKVKDSNLLDTLEKERLDDVKSNSILEFEKEEIIKEKQKYSDFDIVQNIHFWIKNINIETLPIESLYTISFNPASFLVMEKIQINRDQGVRIFLSNGTYHPGAEGPLYPSKENESFFIDIDKETFIKIVEADFDDWDRMDDSLKNKD
jgi:hypothetical protein